jgi:hypothetical protein
MFQNKKIILVLSAIIFSGLQTFGRVGGDLINNGGGLSEKTVLVAYSNLNKYLKLCLDSDYCKLNQKEMKIAQQIFDGLEQENSNLNQIEFNSEQKNSGTFIIDGEVKIAKTGSRIGSPIVVNVDLLYTKNDQGFYIPITVPDAVMMLVHELGHHYGDYSHLELDILGVKVAKVIQNKMYVSPLLPWSQQVSVTVINPARMLAFPEVYINVEDTLIDISKVMEKSVYCPELVLPIPILDVPDIVLSKNKPLDMLMHNVHWGRQRKGQDNVELNISADISIRCAKKNETVRSQDYRVDLWFKVSQGDNSQKFSIDPDSIRIEQKKDRWWKLITIGFK